MPARRGETPTAVASVLQAPPGADGGATPAAVFDRARDALARHDYPSFVRCIASPVRRRWLSDVAFAVALESRENPAEHDLGARRKKATMRELMRVFGARATLTDESLSVDHVTEKLLADVADPDGLLAALLSFAEAHDAPFDPVRALGPSGVDGIAGEGEGRIVRVAPTGSAASAGLRRIGARLGAAESLGELDVADPTHPTALVKVTGEVAPVVLRFVCDVDACFLDES